MTAENLLAESCNGDTDDVVLAGAHIDSVGVNPGIDGNGSGVAVLLEIARQMADVRATNQLRFAFWSGEEGLWGSNSYVAGLSEDERRRIALYLNVELVGASNSVRFVLDGDRSAFPDSVPAPPGSEAIEQLFREHFASRGLPSEELPFADRGADYSPFVAAGVDIPSGGVAGATDGAKTDAQAALYGGIAGLPYDLCYHQRCDTIANIDPRTLDEMSDAVAHALMTYAFDTSSLPSVRARESQGSPSESARTAPRSSWVVPSQ
jgi:Zn-dependent M28 family amino/carboxypeptidase